MEYAMKRYLICVCLLAFTFWALRPGLVSAQALQAVEIVTGLVKDLGVPALLEKVFDKLLKDRTPKEAARPKVRELYASLLEVRSQRESLLQAIQQRIKVLRDPKADPDSRALSRDDLINRAAEAKTAFLRLKDAFGNLSVDIDSSNPELSNAFGSFMTRQEAVYVTKVINVDKVSDLDVARIHLEENRSNLENALKQFRVLTQKVYPDFGELLSPGVFR